MLPATLIIRKSGRRFAFWLIFLLLGDLHFAPVTVIVLQRRVVQLGNFAAISVRACSLGEIFLNFTPLRIIIAERLPTC